MVSQLALCRLVGRPACAVTLLVLGSTPGTTSVVRGQGFPPETAAARMTVADGFEVTLVAAEPLVRQPVCIEFDDRGRLWVIQYLQYPNPAGLKRVAVDRYSRTDYDRVPKPPPHGPRGADRITILLDQDGDGRLDSGRDFATGLNLASGIAFGNGGVYVLNVPYLLFYPDVDRDDIPDRDPQVLLTGFGMQDAHSVANSLTWGPDGWLYGCQGSTVTANIRGSEFQQGVWRYHPPTDRFELFCEGGGNSWGLDFDRDGNLLYSTNYGGFVLLHGVQGGYFVKSFAKHGALHNPHAYGYFDHAPHSGFRGGHVAVGGLVYQGAAFPEPFRGKYIAGDLLGHAVHWHDIDRRGSTVATAHAGELLVANDTWFAPTDLTIGPAGALYVADWHDQRTAHPDPDADWDRSNGRIYRIAPRGSTMHATPDPHQLSNGQLVNRLGSRNQWVVRQARRELVRRQDQAVVGRLQSMVADESDEQAAREAFWTLQSMGAVDEAAAAAALDSPYPVIRYWALRSLGDAERLTDSVAHRLDRFAESEPDAWVRQQLASTAARLPAEQAVPIINAAVIRDIDNGDPYLPLLWWWAVEKHSIAGRQQVIDRFTRSAAWQSRLSREFLLPRLIRRYAAEGTPEGRESVVALVRAAPHPSTGNRMWQDVLQGLLEQRRPEIEPLPNNPTGSQLSRLIRERWQQNRSNLTLQKLAIIAGSDDAFDTAISAALDDRLPAEQRLESLAAIGLRPAAAALPPALRLLESNAGESLRLAALDLLGRLEPEGITRPLIQLHQRESSPAIKSRIRDLLLSRDSTAAAWLAAVDRGQIAASATPIEQIRKVALLENAELNRLVTRHWGRMEAATREEKLAEVRRLNNDLRAGPGNIESGRLLFDKHCSVCHRLFGDGKSVGPDLTSSNRSDTQALLISLVDPSSVIRKEYCSVVVLTRDGRVLTGLPVSRDDAQVKLIDSKGTAISLSRGEIESIKDSAVSLMPEDLYRQWSPQQLRDLFAYLQRQAPHVE